MAKAKVDKLKIFMATLDRDVAEMWYNRGAQFTIEISEADIVQFSGWGEVNPWLFGQKKLPGVSILPAKDVREAVIFTAAKRMKKHCAGIGRGALLCHAMHGGGVYQVADAHGPKVKHMVNDVFDGTSWMAPSSHRQLMQMHDLVTPLCFAEVSSFRDYADAHGNAVRMIKKEGDYGKEPEDLEVGLWWEQDTLCFTPLAAHPGEVETEEKYIEYVTEYLLHNLG